MFCLCCLRCLTLTRILNLLIASLQFFQKLLNKSTEWVMFKNCPITECVILLKINFMGEQFTHSHNHETHDSSAQVYCMKLNFSIFMNCRSFSHNNNKLSYFCFLLFDFSTIWDQLYPGNIKNRAFNPKQCLQVNECLPSVSSLICSYLCMLCAASPSLLYNVLLSLAGLSSNENVSVNFYWNLMACDLFFFVMCSYYWLIGIDRCMLCRYYNILKYKL